MVVKDVRGKLIEVIDVPRVGRKHSNKSYQRVR